MSRIQEKARQIVVKTHEYYDSVRLMQAAEKVRREDGVDEAILMMATDSNKRLLDVAGLLTDEVSAATPNDLVVAIVGRDDEVVAWAMDQVQTLLTETASGAHADATYRTLDSALAAMPDGNLALISVPGEYAAAEARRALERGLNVMLFSDNVSLQDEIELKQTAREADLLLMGPDCGTAIINGVGLGFANAVDRGPVGIVGAAGTGIQELAALLDRRGLGISQAIGTGGRDLSPQVGGMTMLAGLDLLAADEGTALIILISKPPDPQVSEAVLQRAARCGKPVVVNFLSGDAAAVSAADVSGDSLTAAETIEDAAAAAQRLLAGDGGPSESESGAAEEMMEGVATRKAQKLAPGQKYLRGLFSGGTLGYEALLVLKQQLGDVYANIPLKEELRLEDPWRSYRHALVDLGEDTFTQGRAHPMIDSTLRAQRLLQEAQDPATAVILLDVVLGYGAQADPAGSLVSAIEQARAQAEADGRYLALVASVCGTQADPQDRAKQEQTLRDAGVLVAPSNAQAARLAGRIVARGEV